MAREKTENAEEKKTEAKNTEAKEAAPKFKVEQMAPHCEELFKVSPCGYAGATSGLEGEYTINEMDEIIRKWMKQEVK